MILDINPNSIFIFMDEYDRRSFTDYLDFADDGGNGEKYQYSYYPYFLAQQIYQTPTGEQTPDGGNSHPREGTIPPDEPEAPYPYG